jgi:GT2 family glycosyltransferase
VNPNPTLSLSIAIVCYNSNPQELRLLIGSLLAAIVELKKVRLVQPVAVFLIDNSEASGLKLSLFDDLGDQTEKLGVKLHLLNGHGNIGYGSAHNLVISGLESDYHLMLNPDVVLDDQSLVEGLNYLISNKSAVMVSPTASYENGDRQYLCKRYPTVLTLFIRGFLPASWQQAFTERLAHYEMHELYTANTNAMPRSNIPIISGCFMLCKSTALAAIKGFNDQYFLYFEDFDLSLRIAKEGDIAFVPRMRIIHGGGNTAKKGFKHITMFTLSGFRFFKSHGWRWLQHAKKPQPKQ